MLKIIKEVIMIQVEEQEYTISEKYYLIKSS
jgi:hypothetical protein